MLSRSFNSSDEMLPPRLTPSNASEGRRGGELPPEFESSSSTRSSEGWAASTSETGLGGASSLGREGVGEGGAGGESGSGSTGIWMGFGSMVTFLGFGGTTVTGDFLTRLAEESIESTFSLVSSRTLELVRFLVVGVDFSTIFVSFGGVGLSLKSSFSGLSFWRRTAGVATCLDGLVGFLLLGISGCVTGSSTIEVDFLGG
uniref:(northern house mosquito) hypothetical protein n=1 Tax=Culex pipiens TaxID=7175 RepID=A0A8D8LBS8_CULPI